MLLDNITLAYIQLQKWTFCRSTVTLIKTKIKCNFDIYLFQNVSNVLQNAETRT